MKTIKNVLLGFAGIAFTLSSATAVAGVKDSKHNLGSTNSVTSNTTDATTEVCVFCHTPHGADTSAAVPLWNKALPSSASYTTYDSLGTTSLDGGITAVGSVSIACLSCHDGSQAMDVMINQPGSGGYNAAGARLVGTWTGDGTMDIATGLLNQGPVPMIGTDLKNDHPIGIQYGGGGVKLSTPTAATVDKDFIAPQNKVINSQTVWWVDIASGTVGGAGFTGNAAARDKTDMQLYTRTDAALAAEAEPFVECASCHDPHQSATPTFLRVDNTGSAVCLACHDK